MFHKPAQKVSKVPVSGEFSSDGMPFWVNVLFQSLFGLRDGRVRPGECRVRNTCNIPVCNCRNLQKCHMEGGVE